MMGVSLPRTVIVLGLVSLLNDAASEMITPLLPLFLTATLGAGPAIVGLVEGAAEATASGLKLLSGWLADRGWNIRRLVIAGYSLSNAARPLIGLANAWGFVLLLRFADRVGKGIRTAPRDALIAASVGSDARGRAFGFNRSMDHLGAVIGPLAAFALLSNGVGLVQTFLLSGVIGIAVIALLVFGVPRTAQSAPLAARPPLRWRTLDPRLRRLLVASAVLTLATTPEVFLVLWAYEQGLQVAWVPLLWAVASLVKMLVAYPAGTLSDRHGRTVVLAIGWFARVAMLLALAFVPATPVLIWILFASFSASLASTEAAERSLIGDAAREHERGTAFGLYHLITGILVLPGAVLFGAIWQWAGATSAFAVAAALTLAATLFMAGATRRR